MSGRVSTVTVRACGTRSSYNGGCRCDACTKANADYGTAWRHRTGRSDPAKVTPRSHGISRYKAGCRCAVCRRANTAMAERFKRSRGVEPMPWKDGSARRWPQYASGQSSGMAYGGNGPDTDG